MRIALIGYGKMGKELEKLAQPMGYSISAIINDRSWSAEQLHGSDVVIEFTEPTSALDNIKKALSAGIPLVVGTTGWYKELDHVKQLVADTSGAMLFSSNFSLGINIFLRIIRHAAGLINHFDHYDVGGYEIHHRHKKDSPSGTTEAICRELLKKVDRKTGIEYDRLDGVADPSVIHFPSLRMGEMPGTHSVIFDAPEETITLTHEARSRTCFARGALMGASWIKDKKGCFYFEDYIDEVLG